jgi:CHASE3 domain sensor protein
MPLTLVRRVAIRFAVIAAFVSLATICSCVSTAWFIKISNQADQSRKVMRCLSQLQSFIKDAEAGQRGFLLTDGRAEYLTPYNNAITAIGPQLGNLAVLAKSDLPGQKQMVEELEPLIGEKLAELAETIRLHKSGDPEAAVALVSTDRGKHFMDEIRDVVERGFRPNGRGATRRSKPPGLRAASWSR